MNGWREVKALGLGGGSPSQQRADRRGGGLPANKLDGHFRGLCGRLRVAGRMRCRYVPPGNNKMRVRADFEHSDFGDREQSQLICLTQCACRNEPTRVRSP